MLVTSTPSIEGKQIQTYLGIVMGSTVRARHLGTDILATLKNIIKIVMSFMGVVPT